MLCSVVRWRSWGRLAVCVVGLWLSGCVDRQPAGVLPPVERTVDDVMALYTLGAEHRLLPYFDAAGASYLA